MMTDLALDGERVKSEKGCKAGYPFSRNGSAISRNGRGSNLKYAGSRKHDQ
jgi:hypothetical protein